MHWVQVVLFLLFTSTFVKGKYLFGSTPEERSRVDSIPEQLYIPKPLRKVALAGRVVGFNLYAVKETPVLLQAWRRVMGTGTDYILVGQYKLKYPRIGLNEIRLKHCDEFLVMVGDVIGFQFTDINPIPMEYTEDTTDGIGLYRRQSETVQVHEIVAFAEMYPDWGDKRVYSLQFVIDEEAKEHDIKEVRYSKFQHKTGNGILNSFPLRSRLHCAMICTSDDMCKSYEIHGGSTCVLLISNDEDNLQYDDKSTVYRC